MPTPYATLRGRGQTASEQSDGTTTSETRSQVWDITDAVDYASALNAAGYPKINQELYPGSPFRVRSRTPRRTGPTVWEGDVQYGIPPNGSYAPPTNPIDRAKRFLWGFGTTSLPMEQDARQRLVRNSAGDVFDPLPPQERMVETLAVRWTTDVYDRSTGRGYVGRVNSDQFVAGTATVYPRECLCTFYGPDGEYSADTNTINMLANFELQTDSRAVAGASGFPFDAHLVDQGCNGWYADPDTNALKRGFFCTWKTQDSITRVVTIITQPILLNGFGVPLQTEAPANAPIKVTDKPDGTGTVYLPANAPPQFWMARTGAIGDVNNDHSPFSAPNVGSTAARIWLFRGKQAVPFSGIV